jgi:pyruvate formate-lyase activating enzyme-like uncharacterized protein
MPRDDIGGLLLTRITKQNIDGIRNAALRGYAQTYLDIEDDFIAQLESFGLPIAKQPGMGPDDPYVADLAKRHPALSVANDRKSLSAGWISPSCISCRKGVGASTWSISTQCSRSCFFCFNPNQADYARLKLELNDPAKKLACLHAEGIAFHDLALTGGEPLLHKPQTAEFFKAARQLYPHAYTRLYTSGDFLDMGFLDILAKTGLKEIRFSVKTDDAPEAQEATLERIQLARSVLPAVVVEMPVMPDEQAEMRELLLKLDDIGIDGINLLELCFPYNNAAEFKRRGYEIKSRPLRVLYNYQYSGGVPISRSEECCLRLLAFKLERGLRLGVHYCSLENKFSSQVYLQNFGQRKAFGHCSFSDRDYFIKSAKAFGKDAAEAERALDKLGLRRHRRDRSDDGAAVLEFPLTYIERLRAALPNMETAVCYHIAESDGDGHALRELRLDLTTPSSFVLADDL